MQTVTTIGLDIAKSVFQVHGVDAQGQVAIRRQLKRRYFAANAVGGYPFVGTPDRVAEKLAVISKAGVRGIGLSFVNYLNEVPYFCDEVLPRLARQGVRVKH
jgi:alkanesulfonate monooxygenase SsuD/methylene tetrahydromethanopterin reductase-like flavin-dependent oxidoreductase (luciferase family)